MILVVVYVSINLFVIAIGRRGGGSSTPVDRDTIETATLRAVRTGISQATGAIQMERMKEMDWDIILTSVHLGARVTEKEDYTNHFWWQGKFYSRTGKDKRFPPFSVCGFGDVQGIDGANCRHSFGPGDGENNPFENYDSEENRKAYELQQKQREIERTIRKIKRKVMGLKTAVDSSKDEEVRKKLDLEYQDGAAYLQKWNTKYNNFCKENNLKPLRDRLEIAKCGIRRRPQRREEQRNGMRVREVKMFMKLCKRKQIPLAQETQVEIIPSHIL